jgi:hypothetical protein
VLSRRTTRSRPWSCGRGSRCRSSDESTPTPHSLSPSRRGGGTRSFDRIVGAQTSPPARPAPPGVQATASPPRSMPMTRFLAAGRASTSRYVRLLAGFGSGDCASRIAACFTTRQLLTCRELAMESQERRSFAYPLAEPDDALPWVRSLCLPCVRAEASGYRAATSSPYAHADLAFGDAVRSSCVRR